ncbi:MAG: GDP-mannose 4,6-dehydratase, partial [Bacteroidales bacterium]|nr:GDP-mannose 4,6-dehydratase [Bacteroidales bacterium]
PAEEANVCNAKQIADIVDKYDIDTIYNLAALLSATAERLPLKAWDIQMNGLLNILEIAREKRCAVFTPSSIGSFGPTTPHDNTPQDTIQRPTTMYGVTKVATELLSDYYFHRFGVDTRSVRFPGLISYTTPPGGGTTDYAVEIYYAAVKGEEFVCPIAPGTYMDMMYMPDALKAAVDIMRSKPRYLKHRNAFNIASMSLEPEEIAASIRKYIPDFRMRYEVDPVRQHIADSWPDKMDDTCARKEWGWAPSYDLDSMTRDMIDHLKAKLL